jgi:fumarate reductase subunit C
LAKVYHFASVHVGAAMPGTLWYLVFLSSLTYVAVRGQDNVWVGNIVVSYALLILLVVIVVMALPPSRVRAHDYFEMTPRFGGWAALGLVWANPVLFVNSQ